MGWRYAIDRASTAIFSRLQGHIDERERKSKTGKNRNIPGTSLADSQDSHTWSEKGILAPSNVNVALLSAGCV